MRTPRSNALLGSLLFVLGGLALGCGASAPPPSGAQPSGGPPSEATRNAEPSGSSEEEAAPTDGPGRPRGIDKAPGEGGNPPPPPAPITGAGDKGGGAPEQATASSAPLSGRMTQQEIAQILSNNAAYFNDCYTIGAGKGQEFKGTVTVKATVGPSGNVTDAQVIKSTAKNAKVDACVVTAFKKIKFPVPKDGATSVITFPMEFQGVEQVR